MGELLFIGLGLYDEKDVTLRGLEEARSCDLLFTELFTSRLMGTTLERLSDLHGKEIRVLSREEVEGGDLVVEATRRGRVGFLVAGDPMAATTHVELRLRAHREDVPTRVISGVSALTSVAGVLGLQIYKFGRTITIPFRERGFEPVSPYEMLGENRSAGLHTLALLDIEDDRYMTACEGMEYFLECEAKLSREAFVPETLVCAVGRLGSPEPLLRADQVKVLLEEDLGPPLHVLVIPGKLHFMEVECLSAFAGLPEALAQHLSSEGDRPRSSE
ncbi:MAG: diphthine synthase [Thermoplasmata archaeon]